MGRGLRVKARPAGAGEVWAQGGGRITFALKAVKSSFLSPDCAQFSAVLQWLFYSKETA